MNESATLFSSLTIPEFWKLRDSKKVSSYRVKAASATLELLLSTINNITIALDRSIFDAKSAYDTEAAKIQAQAHAQ